MDRILYHIFQIVLSMSREKHEKCTGNLPIRIYVLHLEVIEVVSINCNIFKNNYQYNRRAFYIFLLNKSFSQLLDISSENFMFLKTFPLEFSYVEVQFTDQNFKPLEMEDKINITSDIN